jgi:hypothetical protein
MMANEKSAALKAALVEHRKALDEYDRLQRALALAETVLGMTRHAVGVATHAIKEEGVD